MPYSNEQLILFYYPNTIGSRKMLLVLYTRGISFMPRVMDVPNGEQMEPWFLDMSPLGELPVLKHGDSVFTDVHQMMVYIDQVFPSTDPVGKLFPDKGTDLGDLVESVVRDLGKINIPLIVYGTLFHPEMAVSSGMTDDEQKKKAALVKQGKAQILELMERNPDYLNSYLEKQHAYDAFLSLAQSENAVNKELEEVEKTMDNMEALLNSRKVSGTTTPDTAQMWMFSIYVSAADIHLMVLLHAVYKAGLWDRYFEKTQKKHKNLTRYFKRMKHDPLISKALPGLIK
ncbi:ganglioside induced differentiation associated protein 1 isoform X2 [Rhipicephalus microplus]|uniref:ganglioside induced differentiation associated protein 1 isoform X2 n=1 Tax=Rhipicephalus microplus TaxID=6941 RepID=UPI003F6B432B